MNVRYEFADFVVDPERGSIVRRGYPVLLQDQPFRLLVLLLAQPGTVVTREEIQSNLWPANTYVEFDKSLRVAVSKLREALRDSASEPIYIETVPRRGYRFIAPVIEVSKGSVLAPDQAPALAITTAESPERALEQPANPEAAAIWNAGRRVRPAWLSPARIAFGAAALLILASGSFYLAREGSRGIETPQVEAHPVLRKSIAVIGLRNLNGSPSDRWLGTALAEMLSNELSVSDRLRVVSGEEVSRAGLSDAPANTPSRQSLAQYANRLGANMIVFGSYTVSRDSAAKSASKLRLDLRVEDLSSDAPPMALVETGMSTVLFALVSASGAEMRQRFGLGEVPAASADAVRRTLPSDPVAAQFYAEGLSRLRNFDPPGARDLLLKAAKLEPSHAGTHLALADAWHAMGYDLEAHNEAARAVELAAGLPRQELLEMQGQLAMLSNDWTKASDLFRSLFTFYPDDAGYGLRLVKAQYYGSHAADALATLQTLHKEGLSQADEARIDIAEANAHLQIDDFREAIAAADQAIKIGAELDLKMIRADALWIKASGLERMGNLDGSLSVSSEAQSLYQAAGDKRGQGLATMMAGDVLYDRAQPAEARKKFLASLAFFRELGHQRNAGICLERIGNTYFDEGAMTESRQYYQQTLDIYRQIHWDSGIGSALGNIANVQEAEGDISGALISNQQGLDLAEKSGSKRGVGSTYSNMGNIEMERGGLDRASAYFNRAAQIQEQIGYARGLANARIGQGDVLLARNDIAAAKHAYDLAAKAIEGMDEPAVLAQVKVSVGIAAFQLGNADQAVSSIEQARDLSLKNKDHGAAAYDLAWLSRCLLQQGRKADALADAQQSIAESQLQFGPRIRLIASLALARVEIAQGNTVAAQALIRASVQTAQRDGYGPLDLELRTLLAETEPPSAARRRQLEELAREASGKGWKLLAMYANKFIN